MDLNSLKDNTKKIFETTVKATRLTHVINKCVNEDEFLCSKETDALESNISSQTNKIWTLFTTMTHNLVPQINLKKNAHLPEQITSLVEINDIILDNIFKDLDRAKGINVTPQPVTLNKSICSNKKQFWNQIRDLDNSSVVKKQAKPFIQFNSSSHQKSPYNKTPSVLASCHVVKPQEKYHIRVDNSKTPFKSSLKTKYHGMTSGQDNASDGTEFKPEPNVNPFFEELELLEPLPNLFESVDQPKFPADLEKTPLIFVSNASQLEAMVQELAQENVIAVDLEHHSFRSFLGLTCLIQISSRHKDYLVDPFKLWNELQELNRVFTDPKIIKVFHGADKDIEWLQRDFSVYVVNLFDTHFAAQALNLPTKSLAYLLSQYCNVEAQKEYQLADWRIRPLTEEMIKYARSDTHYLIYIYKRMKNDILLKDAKILDSLKVNRPPSDVIKNNINNNNNKNLSNNNTNNSDSNNNDDETEQLPVFERAEDMKRFWRQKTSIHTVFHRSRRLCQKVYIKPYFSPEFYTQLLARQNKRFNARQMFVLRAINEWRDRVARKEDESPWYVLSNQLMLKIAEILPKNYMSLLSCANPTPPLLKQNIHHVQSLIQNALKRSLFEIQDGFSPSTLNFDSENVGNEEDGGNNSFTNTSPTTKSVSILSYTPNCSPFYKPLSTSNLAKHDFSYQTTEFPTFNRSTQPADVASITANAKSNLFELFNDSQNLSQSNEIKTLPSQIAQFFKSPYDIFRDSESIKLKFKEDIEKMASDSKCNETLKASTTNHETDVQKSILDHESHIVPIKANQDPDDFIKVKSKKYKRMRPYDKLTNPKPSYLTPDSNNEIINNTNIDNNNNNNDINNEINNSSNENLTKAGDEVNKKDKGDRKKHKKAKPAANNHMFDELTEETTFDYDKISYSQILLEKKRGKKHRKNNDKKDESLSTVVDPDQETHVEGIEGSNKPKFHNSKKLKMASLQLNSRTKSMTFKY